MTPPRPAGGEGLRREARHARPATLGPARGHGGSLENDPAGQAARARLALVDAFVRRHFTWPGTLRLHRAALGADILRAPVNVLMSPILVLAGLSAWTCRRLRLHAAADWLNRRRFLLRTAVAARVETAVLTELLKVPLGHGEDREALCRAILAARAFGRQSAVAEASAGRRPWPRGSCAPSRSTRARVWQLRSSQRRSSRSRRAPSSSRPSRPAP